MRLHVLVNHHGEPDETVARFLCSLAMQERVDWSEVGVSIMTDGEEFALDEGFADSFGIHVEYVVAQHRGVCATRNALMDSSDADYVMLCDVDDGFHSTLGLAKVLKAIDDMGCDIIASPYDVELPDRLVRDKADVFHVHGKAFRREFLVENDIRFPDMPFSGDMCFLWLAFALADRSCWLTDSFYVWRDNPNSVTRRDPHHRLNTYHMVLRNYELLYDDLADRGRMDLQDALLGSVFAMMYVDDVSMDGPADAVGRAKAAISDFASRFSDRYLEVPDRVARMTFDGARGSHGDHTAVRKWVQSFDRTNIQT